MDLDGQEGGNVICPECEAPTRVTKTTASATAVTRALMCPACGIRYESTETITHTYRHRQPPVAISGQGPPPISTGNHPSLVIASGGVGGGLSSGQDSVLIPASSGPSEQSGSGSHSDRDPDRARSKGYPIAFELTWKATWGEGSKGAAHKAWIKTGRPTADQVKPAAAAYLAAKASSGEKTAHVSTWLNDGGHLQVDWKLSPLPDRNAQPTQRQAAPAPYHAPAKPVQADWSQIKPWPKEGKGTP